MKSKQRLHIDYETKSEVDLTKIGAPAYAMHPSTEMIMVAWKFVDEETQEETPVRQWDASEGVNETLTDFLDLVFDTVDVINGEHYDTRKYAHNAFFEICISLFTLPRQFPELCDFVDVPTHEWYDAPTAKKAKRQRAQLFNWLSGWRCTQQMGMALSLPMSLFQQGTILGAKHLKEATEGKSLIRLFSMPQKKTKNQPHRWRDWNTDPDRWDSFKHYNRVDVDAESDNYKRMRPYSPMNAREWENWIIDVIMNLTGVPVDMELVDAAIDLDTQVQDILIKKMKDLTGLGNPNSRDQLLAWLKKRGFKPGNLQKKTVSKELALIEKREAAYSEHWQDLVEALELRQITSKTSVSKFMALRRCICPDGRLRGILQFYGASRTGRWAGRMFQPQNLPQSMFKAKEIEEIIRLHEEAIEIIKTRDLELADSMYDLEELPTVLSSLIRCAINHGTDDKFQRRITVADLSSIESIGLGVAAASKEMISDFAKGIDPYIKFATVITGKKYDTITKDERKEAKPATLGCGYRLGGKGLVEYAEGYGVTLSIKRASQIVRLYRKNHEDVTELWKSLERAAMHTIQHGTPAKVNGFTFHKKGPVLYIRLPSGRRLSYVKSGMRPALIKWEDPETGEVKEFETTNVTYKGIDQFTKKWTTLDTHGGKLTENVVQAWARDVLATGLREVFWRGQNDAKIDIRVFHSLLHVHDEIATASPNSGRMDTEQGEVAVTEFLEECMTTPEEWSSHVPLRASSFESQFYLKD